MDPAHCLETGGIDQSIAASHLLADVFDPSGLYEFDRVVLGQLSVDRHVLFGTVSHYFQFYRRVLVGDSLEGADQNVHAFELKRMPDRQKVVASISLQSLVITD